MKKNAIQKMPRKSEKYYREITDNYSNIIIVTDASGNIKYCSNSIERYGGYKPGDMVGKTAFDFFHPDDVKRAFGDYCKSILADENTLIPNAFRVMHKNGSVIYLEGIGRNLLNNADIRGFVMNVRDVTEKRLAEEELKKSEARYKLIAEHVKDYVCVFDMNLKPTYVSPSLEKDLEYNFDEIANTPLENFFTKESFQKTMEMFSGEMSKIRTSLPDHDYKGSLEVQLCSRSGRLIWLESTFSYLHDDEGNPVAILAEGRNITERKNSEEELRKSEERYRLIAEHVKDYVCVFDMNLNPTYVSPSVEKDSGYTFEEIKKTPLEKFFTEESFREVMGIYSDEKAKVELSSPDHDYKGSLEVQLQNRDGRLRWVESTFSFLHDDEGKPVAVLAEGRDITERKAAEEEMRKSENRYRFIAEHMKDFVWVYDLNIKPTYVSPSIEKATGYTSAELKELPLNKLLTKDTFRKAMKMYSEEISGARHNPPPPDYKFSIEGQVRRRDGSTFWIEATLSFLQNRKGETVAVLGEGRDITERKKADERYWLLSDNITEHVWLMDLKTLRMTYVSPSVEKMYGYTAEEIMKLSLKKILTEESYRKVEEAFVEEAPKAAITLPPAIHKYTLELQARHRDGHLLWIENTLSFLRNEGGVPSLLLGETRDITLRKLAEDKLREEEDRFRALAEQSSDIIVLVSPEGKIIYENSASDKILGYNHTARIGKSVYENIHPDDAAAVVTGHNILLSDINAPVQKNESRIRHADGTWHTFEITASNLIQNNALKAIIINLRDITERKRVEDKLQQTLDNLRKSFTITIQVLTSAIEMKDPYTAGHQARVADIAAAIARQMGLPDETIEGLRMAGSIHDIGKISVPSELLTKPTKLTDIEFSLIKEHSQRGFEMLKNIESPWPLAQIIQQHHERMDGSGYPKHIKGDEILLEARILAVADLVEAMASHRPYRPSKGLQNALDEIEQNRGILYDDTVVSACLKLFREEGYKLH